MLKPTSSSPSDGSGIARFLICERDLANAIPPARARYRFELNVVLIVSVSLCLLLWCLNVYTRSVTRYGLFLESTRISSLLVYPLAALRAMLYVQTTLP